MIRHVSLFAAAMTAAIFFAPVAAADEPIAAVTRAVDDVVDHYGLPGIAVGVVVDGEVRQLELRGEIYAHVWGWIAFVLVPWVVLGGLPDYVRPIEQASAVAGVAQRIALFLVPPLLAIYYVILYAYVVRILVTQEIPKNLVSPLVLAAGGLAALGLLLFDPRPGARGVGRSLRIAPALFLPLVPLGVWALLQRTGQYGLTEFRLVRLIALAVLALLAIGATVQLVRRRSFTLHVVPLALATAALLSAVGPWSVLAFSRRSQQDLLSDALARLEIPANDSTWQSAAPDSAPRIVAGDLYEQVRGSAGYLARHFGAGSLPPVLERYARDYDHRWRDYAADLRLQPDATTIPGSVMRFGTLHTSEPFTLEGGMAWRVGWSPPYQGGEVRPMPSYEGQEGEAVRIVAEDSVHLRLNAGGRDVRADMSALIAGLPGGIGPRPGRDAISPEAAIVPVTGADGEPQGQLVVWHIMVNTDSTGTNINRLEGLLVLREPDAGT